MPEKTTGTRTEGLSSVDGIGAFPDIGNILAPSKSTDELWTSLNALSKGEKFSFLYNHVQPPNALPSTFSYYGANCRFQISWLSKYPWLLYSPKLDGVFCGPCALFMFVLLNVWRILMVGKDSHSITPFLLNFVKWLYMVIVNFVNLMMAGLQKTRRMLLHI